MKTLLKKTSFYNEEFILIKIYAINYCYIDGMFNDVYDTSSCNNKLRRKNQIHINYILIFGKILGDVHKYLKCINNYK